MLTVIDRPPGGREASHVAVWDGGSEQSLILAMNVPTTDCVEAGLPHRESHRRRHRDMAGRLRLTVTTLSTYRQPIAKSVAGALARRLQLSRALHERVRTALQEAVMNAMMHGNLGLDSNLREDLQGVAASQALIESLLDDPEFADRPIRIEAVWNAQTLHIAVADSGAGFEPGKPAASETPHREMPHGRGLFILESFCDRVTLLRRGTTIKLTFRL